MGDRPHPGFADLVHRLPHADRIDLGRGGERADHHRHVVAPALRVRHIGEQEGPPLVLGNAAQELPAHQRMQLGVLVDRPVDAHQQAVGLEVGEVLLEIEPRPAALAQAGAAQIGGLIEHLAASGSTDRMASRNRSMIRILPAIGYSIWPAGCITLAVSAGAASTPMSHGPMATQTIDVHAHILTEETIRLLQRESPKVAPKLTDVDDQFGTLDVAGSVYRHFPRGGWDLDRRLQDMAASKVDVQVLSVCPQTFVYAQPPALAAAFARIQNEQLAKLVKTHPGRFLAIATLPMQAPEARCRRASPCDDARSACAACRSARMSPARISTIPSSSRSGPRPPSSAPSSCSIPSMWPASTG